MTEVVNTIQPPDWVTKELIQSKLRSGLKNEDIKIEKCVIKPAVSVGDNYASQMFRVSLQMVKNGNAEPENMSIILKILPSDAKMQELIHESQAFVVETRMFVETLPAMQRIMDEFAPGKYPKLYADTYYHEGEPNDMLILEDLCASGFMLANRFEGLDLEHSVFVLENLARLHASSFALTKRDPSVAKQYDDYMYKECNSHMFKKILEGGMTTLAKECDTWSDLPKTYVKKLENMKPVILSQFFESYKRDDNSKVNVIIHGDTWLNNMMFKHEGNRLVAMKFVDFQIACYNSIAIDVVYFIFSSPQQEVRDNHYDLLFEKYYKSFMNTLDELDTKIDFSFEEFKQEILDRLFYGFVISFLLFPITCAPREDAPDMGKLVDSSDEEYGNANVFRSDYFKKVAKKCFPFFEEKGII